MTYQKQTTVGVIPNPTIDFKIEANPVTPGKPLSFTLGWTVKDVNLFQVTANDGPDGTPYVLPVPFSREGTYPVTPHRLDTTYTMQVITKAAPHED
ncbi:MAG TPA: hypothetical protein VF064_19600 [Pyrinomonadaceae bacterium]